MALKNRTSEGNNTFNKIQKILSENGAKKVMFDYDGSGAVEAISFALEIDGKIVGFQLPAMVENVFNILYPNNKEYRFERYIKSWREQAYKTAWANIRDWIDAQMALVAMRQAKVEQVFLPYVVTRNGQTLYEKFADNSQFLLGDGQ